jgi:DNA-binding response OmpR family regulator
MSLVGYYIFTGQIQKLAKILIIEDTYDIAEMLRHLFSSKSYDVETAYNQQMAFKKFIAFAPDLILLDVWLQNIDGKQLCKEIRAINKKIPIILMSANPDSLKGYEVCEANDIIEKPFDINVLLNKIERLIIQAGEEQ